MVRDRVRRDAGTSHDDTVAQDSHRLVESAPEVLRGANGRL